MPRRFFIFDDPDRKLFVVDAQGVVVLRPMLAQRWTPICREAVLKTGDWLRTDIRGAKALPCGHYLSEEAPEETYKELREFFLAN